MNRRIINTIVILLILAGAIWVNIPNNGGIHIGSFSRTLETVLGLDLRGGLQVLLEADVPETQTVDAQQMQDARSILENRSNGLGVSEVVFQVAGNRRILGEFPGLSNPDEVLNVLKGTGQLEFVDVGSQYQNVGTVLKTNLGIATTDNTEPTAAPTVEPTTTPAAAGTEAAPAATPAASDTVWPTIMTGKDLQQVGVGRSTTGEYQIDFKLKDAGSKIFADHTSANVGKYLCITLDKVVISCPQIQTAITQGSGTISGNFTGDSANALAVQLRYGSLPVGLKIVETKVVGPTLGQDSLNKSLMAGIVGFIIVALFMAIYYRVPGTVADLSILIYAVITLAIYKLIPVTLTLPGVAGFLLSTGSALDANILIFERLKEELRAGRTLRQAIDIGWKRAWPSIRDSNISALITCAILFWFGSSFGASIVKGFAVTLSLGVVVSLFTSIFVTRTFLSYVVEWFNPEDRSRWYGA